MAQVNNLHSHLGAISGYGHSLLGLQNVGYGASSQTAYLQSGNNDVQKQTERKETMLGMKDYVLKHRDLIWTVVLALILDQVVLKGTLRKRLTEMVEGFLKKIEEQAKS